jgi:hypothetical protein
VSATLASAIVQAATAYVGAGLVVAVPLVWAGIPRLDPAARGTTWGFRAIIIPGVVLLWPLLVARLAAGSTHPPREQNAHRRRATVGAAR